MCSSAAMNGCYGCEIWLSGSIAIGSFHEKKFIACRDSTSVLHASPRLLFVGVNIGPFALACVSARAPHHSSKEFLEWQVLFKNVQSKVSRMYTHIVGGVDLKTVFNRIHTDNMHFGTVACNRSVPSKFSEAVSRDITDAELRLVNSMELHCRPSYIGNPFTYISIDAYNARAVDYIVTSPSVLVAYGSIDRSLLGKYSTRVTDHYPLVGGFSILAVDPKNAPYSRRAQDVDVSKIGGPECDRAFLNCLSNCSGVPFGMDVTSHNFVLDQVVTHVCHVCCIPNSGIARTR